MEKEKESFTKTLWANVPDIKLPDLEALKKYREEISRCIYIYEDIDEKAMDITTQIINYNIHDNIYKIPLEKRKPIKIYFFSRGGLVSTALSICDVIRSSETPVYGINMGECSSAAAVIYSCCHRRYALPNSFFLLHLGSGGNFGAYRDMKKYQEHYDEIVNKMKQVLIEQLHIKDVQNFEKLIDNEWYLYTSTDSNNEHCAQNYNLVTKKDFSEFFIL